MWHMDRQQYRCPTGVTPCWCMGSGKESKFIKKLGGLHYLDQNQNLIAPRQGWSMILGATTQPSGETDEAATDRIQGLERKVDIVMSKIDLLVTSVQSLTSVVKEYMSSRGKAEVQEEA
ncbi:hypothetical protein CFOL_v3_16103 [Cephalotus follicularis]|uniref:Uncharacterized protein n=1 Tax=Cephalotus follicularis TaxID=3775 RepID=A0A1Q3BXA2_CEPFO|nr:hypothetical protein CFOL_v3_16103 [Cephalotus follicularis]